jgi:hypothetical protein
MWKDIAENKDKKTDIAIKENELFGFVMEHFNLKWQRMIDALDKVERFKQVELDRLEATKIGKL